MKSVSSILMFALAVAFVAAGLFLIMQSDDAIAAKDTCYDAVIHIYGDCDLKLIVDSDELSSVNDAVTYCRDLTDVALRACWTNCSLDNPDCGVMAGCIDECFDGETECGFVVEMIYENCYFDLLDPNDLEAKITQQTALTDCSNVDTALEPFWSCISTCAYENWNNCTSMAPCLEGCYENELPDDDVAEDDDTSVDDDDTDGMSEKPKQAKGGDFDSDGGSACGI